eukprot:TRINITY_DN1282_c0_g1_i1.p1 TRINITY_DN1282_c0_g1~~TRINITY_DN1282_c0_g1_i1.p1  ORF type:complete len:653 (-),score=81.05 TRINITY_DN1282_c0_g1_i1:571-2529(-)
MGRLLDWKLPVLMLLLLAPAGFALSPDLYRPDAKYDSEPEEVEPTAFGDLSDSALAALAGGASRTLYVTLDSSKWGNKDTFDGIQAAVNTVPAGSTVRTIIMIDHGVYHGQVELEKQNMVTFYGDPSNPRNVVLEAKHTAADVDTEGRRYGTYRSPSLIIRAVDFIAIGISFINLSDRPAPGAQGAQAVAVRATGDRQQFYNCIFTSFQDTLYAHKGRQLYKNCLMEGTIDFIFGYAQAQFEDCNLHARADPYSFTAQKRNLSTDPNGFIFLRCNLTCEPSLPGQGQAFLGRSWGVSARTYYIDSYMYDVVYPPGWSNMGFAGRERTADFAEYNNSGPGADRSQRVPWAKTLTLREVEGYRNPARPFINGASWVTVPEDLGPTPEPLVMCSGHDEAGIAPGPMPDLPADTPDSDLPPTPTYNSVEYVVSAMDAKGDFATFLYFFKSSGLEEELSTAPPQPLTFFPPIDSAFDSLSNYSVNVLSHDANLLKRVLSYHIVKGFYPDAVLLSLPQQNLPTLAGFGFPILSEPAGVFVGQDLKAEVVKHNVFVDTGSYTAAQGINRVLVSPFVDYLTPPVIVPSPTPSTAGGPPPAAATGPPPKAAAGQPPVADSPQNVVTVRSLLEGNSGVRIKSHSWRLLGISSLCLCIFPFLI